MLCRRELFRRQKAVAVNEQQNEAQDSGLSRDIPSIESDDRSPKNSAVTEDLSAQIRTMCLAKDMLHVQSVPQPPTPIPQKKPAFSLPRLFLPKSLKSTLSPSKRTAARVSCPTVKPPATTVFYQQPQHSPSTTTSAYNTGGETGQESPVEKMQQQQMESQGLSLITTTSRDLNQNSNISSADQLRRVPASPTLRTRHQSPAENSKPRQTQRVRFESTEAAPLPQAVFYTSTERLAQTIAAQKRLLRQELGGVMDEELVESAEKEKRNMPGGTSGAENTAVRHQHVPKTPSSSTSLSAPQLRHGTVQMTRRDGIPVMHCPPAAPSTTSAQRPTNASVGTEKVYPIPLTNWPRPEELAQLFAFKSDGQRQSVRREQKEQNQTRERRRGSPSKQISGMHRQQPSAELEWIVKRRPDGSRYVTRKSVRKRATPALAGVKARREQSLQRERAGMSTTDDDGGSEVGGGAGIGGPKWWTQRRRKPPPAPPGPCPPTARNPGGGRTVHFGQEVQQRTLPNNTNSNPLFNVTTV